MTTDPKATRPKKIRRLGWRSYGALILIFLVLACAVAYGFWGVRTSKQLEAEINSIRARGEPITPNDLAAGATAEGKLAYELLQQAEQSYWEIDAQTGRREQLSQLAWNEEKSSDETWTAEFALAVEDFLLEQQPTFELVDQALAFSRIDFPLVNAKGIGNTSFAGQNSYLFGADIPLQRKLYVAGFRGRAEEFVATFEQLSHLARSIEHHPDEQVQWARSHTLYGMVATLTQSLPRLRLTDDHFRRLDQLLVQAERQTRMRPVIWGERVRQSDFFHKLAIGEKNVEDQYADRFSWRETWTLRVTPQLHVVHTMMLRYYAEIADLIDTPGPTGAAALASLQAEIEGLHSECDFIGVSTDDMEFLRQQGLTARQRLINAPVLLRIDRHFRVSGEFPSSLQAVQDAELPAIPLGLNSGNPLRYSISGLQVEIGDEFETQLPSYPTRLRVDYNQHESGVSDDLEQRTEDRR